MKRKPGVWAGGFRHDLGRAFPGDEGIQHATRFRAEPGHPGEDGRRPSRHRWPSRRSPYRIGSPCRVRTGLEDVSRDRDHGCRSPEGLVQKRSRKAEDKDAERGAGQRGARWMDERRPGGRGHMRAGRRLGAHPGCAAAADPVSEGKGESSSPGVDANAAKTADIQAVPGTPPDHHDLSRLAVATEWALEKKKAELASLSVTRPVPGRRHHGHLALPDRSTCSAPFRPA
jgi:hypothetical protein